MTTDPTQALSFPKRTSSNPKHPERLSPKAFREAVWKRDGGKDRATGERVYASASSPIDIGQVCHLKGRRVMPEWATDPKRALLMSARNHWWSDGRGNYRLKLTDPETGEPATDASRPIRFTMHDKDGNVLWSRIG